MAENHEMNYYNYGKTLSAEGVIPIINENITPDPEPTPDPELEHEYVDLGLPSGTLWATENIKNENGEELYFAWGETQGYTSGQVGTDKSFSLLYNKYINLNGQGQAEYTKYNETDGKTELDADDDAATVNWGEGWKMPTKEEFEELTANTTSEQTEVDGVVGWLFTSTVEGYTNKSIFFPAVGEAQNSNVIGIGDECVCWSSSLYVDDVSRAWNLILNNKGAVVDNFLRYFGFSVRPVRVENI